MFLIEICYFLSEIHEKSQPATYIFPVLYALENVSHFYPSGIERCTEYFPEIQILVSWQALWFVQMKKCLFITFCSQTVQCQCAFKIYIYSWCSFILNSELFVMSAVWRICQFDSR